MPGWGDILEEIRALMETAGLGAFDRTRRKYLAALAEYTGRSTIFYGSKWTSASQVPPEFVSITEEDVQGLMAVVYKLPGTHLDVILHSPGGSAEAAEAIVHYLRSKFDDIRFLVPQAAMSAATMLATAGNSIVMGKQSSLGPIDPQMILATPLGVRAVPAYAIMEQFRLAQRECQDNDKLASWYPMLAQYGPGLLIECETHMDLSEALVKKWIGQYMFGGAADKQAKAQEIAHALADHKRYGTHARHIDREQAKALGLSIVDLEADQELQDRVLSAFHAATFTLEGTGATKIIENHQGRAFIKQTMGSPAPAGATPRGQTPAPQAPLPETPPAPPPPSP